MSQKTEGDPRYKVPFQRQDGDITIFGYEALVPRGTVDRKELASKLALKCYYEELAKPGETIVSPQAGESIVVPEGFEAYRLTTRGSEDNLEYFDSRVKMIEYKSKSSNEKLVALRQMAQEEGYPAAIDYALGNYLSATWTYDDVRCGEKEWDVFGEITAEAFGVQPDIMRTFMGAMTRLAEHRQFRKNYESG